VSVSKVLSTKPNDNIFWNKFERPNV
jgi:hypothetical protein